MRIVEVNFTRPCAAEPLGSEGIPAGVRGENHFTTLKIRLPTELCGLDYYICRFELPRKKSVCSEALFLDADGWLYCPLWSQVTIQACTNLTVECYEGETVKGCSPLVHLTFEDAVVGPAEAAIPDVPGGGLPGSSADYTLLKNKPSINGVTLIGDKSDKELGWEPYSNFEIEAILNS